MCVCGVVWGKNMGHGLQTVAHRAYVLYIECGVTIIRVLSQCLGGGDDVRENRVSESLCTAPPAVQQTPIQSHHT